LPATPRFLLGLLTPKPRGRPIELDLPEDARAGDILAAFDATLAAMAAGEITPEEALIVTKVLDARRHAIETLALERLVEGQGEAAADIPANSLHSTSYADFRVKEVCGFSSGKSSRGRWSVAGLHVDAGMTSIPSYPARSLRP
jgi:hypothetical protein